MIKLIARSYVQNQCALVWVIEEGVHKITYGAQVTECTTYESAAREFQGCFEHALGCLGVHDEPCDANKLADYFGQTIEVPEWASAIACDADGALFAYDVEPELGLDCWCCGPEKYKKLHHTYVNKPCPFWAQSLVIL